MSAPGGSSVQCKYRYESKYTQHRRHSLSRYDIAWMAPAAVPTVERLRSQAQGVGLAFAEGGPQRGADARVLGRKLAARRSQLAPAAERGDHEADAQWILAPSRTLPEDRSKQAKAAIISYSGLLPVIGQRLAIQRGRGFFALFLLLHAAPQHLPTALYVRVPTPMSPRVC